MSLSYQEQELTFSSSSKTKTWITTAGSVQFGGPVMNTPQAFVKNWQIEYSGDKHKMLKAGIEITDLEVDNSNSSQVNFTLGFLWTNGNNHNAEATITVVVLAEAATGIVVSWDTTNNQPEVEDAAVSGGSGYLVWQPDADIVITAIGGTAERVFGTPQEADGTTWVAFNTGLTGDYEYSLCATYNGGDPVCIDPQITNDPQPSTEPSTEG